MNNIYIYIYIKSTIIGKVTNIILEILSLDNEKFYSKGLLFLNSYQKHLLNIENINDSINENVIITHIKKLLYPLIKFLQEEGQIGIITSDTLTDMYILITKFHLLDNQNFMMQFKNDILKGFVIDSNIEKEKVLSKLENII